MQHFYGIEAGGTKFVCAWGSGPEDIRDRVVIPTTTPEETMSLVISHIRMVMQKTKLSGIGAAVFGPLALNPEFDNYGCITSTPKKAWRHYNFVGALHYATKLPIVFDTDVNVTAIGEQHWGAGKHVSDFIYMTVGTGIGAGAIVNHKICHGALHPEMGHILIPKRANDSGQSVCPYHESCLEGLASGPALHARWGVSDAFELAPTHEAWELEAHYLATAIMNYTLCLSPKRIILGGGVMQQTQLFPLIRNKVKALINDYVQNEYLDNINDFIVPALLKHNAGVLGAIALAQSQFAQKIQREVAV
jgi:fructokinase